MMTCCEICAEYGCGWGYICDNCLKRIETKQELIDVFDTIYTMLNEQMTIWEKAAHESKQQGENSALYYNGCQVAINRIWDQINKIKEEAMEKKEDRWMSVKRGELPQKFDNVICPAEWNDPGDGYNTETGMAICQYNHEWESVDKDTKRRSKECKFIPVFTSTGCRPEHLNTEVDLWKSFPKFPEELELEEAK